MIKTKTAWKRVLLILIAAVTMFTVFAESFPKASAAVTYPFNVIRTLNVDSTAPYSAYGLKENVTIGNGGTVKGGYNWSVLLLKTSNGYEPAYCVEPSKSVADCTYSEKNMSYSADTKK